MPIMTIRNANPMVDGRQSDRALAIQRGVVRHFQSNGIALLPEFILPTGRRADLVGLDGKGAVVLIEIKSSVEDYRADEKWPEYRRFCDHFFFASHSGVPASIFPEDEGLIMADDYGAEIIRPPRDNKLAGATRKALTLRFARASAARLERVVRFAESSGVETPTDLSEITGD